MKGIKIITFLLILLGFHTFAQAQYIAVDETLTPTQLVQNILINNPCANISNVAVTTYDFGNGKSYGKFTNGGSTFPFADGIVLTTGRAKSATGPNTSILSEGPDSWLGDPELEQALQISQNSSINATVLEFDFLPLSDKISFDYIFSSEQYLLNGTPAQCNYTDGFVFLLKKANTSDNYTNLAVVPGTDIPVKVNTVRAATTSCPIPQNAQYFDAFNTSNHPTNYNGQTKVLTAKSIVVPGVLYHIKLVVADQGNRQYDSAIFLGGGSFKIGKNLGADRLISTTNPLCFGENLVLNATEPGTNTYKWFKNGVQIPFATNPLYTVTDAGTFSVEINLANSGCISKGEVKIEYAPKLTATGTTIVQCDPDLNGITNFNLTKATPVILASDPTIQGIEYFQDNLATIQVNDATSFDSGNATVYAKVTNNTNCSAIVPVTLSISNANPPGAAISFCDEDGTKDGTRQFDLATEVSPIVLNGLPTGLNVTYYLTANNALNSSNPLSNSYTNTTASQQVIWAKITNGPDCYGIIPVTLMVNYLIVPNFDDEEKTVCQGLNSVSLSVATGFQSYLWNDANASTTNTIMVTTAGNYLVKVTDANGCSATKKFIVSASKIATITEVTIEDFNGGDNTVTIKYDGIGIYEFSIDGNFYQESPVFYNVPSGSYTVYVKNSCGIKRKEIFVLDFPKYFTPNGDGFNDVWKIEYLQKQNRRAQVNVFDRYGALVFSGTGDNAGWDGTYKSNPLPASDYWFTITLENGRVIKGHFSLKR